MTERSTIVAFWGEDAMRRWPRSVSLAAGLTSESADYLADVGLPGGREWSLSFSFNEPWPNLLETPDQPDLISLGNDGDALICVHRKTGEVFIADKGRVEFMNSSLASLGEFLMLYTSFIREAGFGAEKTVRGGDGTLHVVDDPQFDRASLRAARRRVRDAMRRCDKAALSSREHVWPQILAS